MDTVAEVGLFVDGPMSPFCLCIRSHGPAAAGQLGDNLVTSEAEPRLLSGADSGAVRHSFHLRGCAVGGHREESGREGRQEGAEDATARGGRDGIRAKTKLQSLQ